MPPAAVSPNRRLAADKAEEERWAKVVTSEIVLLPADEAGVTPRYTNVGDRIMGYLYCKVDKPFHCSSIRVKLKGEAACSFELCVGDEGSSSGSSGGGGGFRRCEKTSVHTNKQTYVNTFVHAINKAEVPRVAVPGRTEKQFMLDKGEFRFPFAFQLPADIPPSFAAGQEASVYYGLSVWLHRGEDKPVRLCSRSVEIVDTTSLAYHSLLQPEEGGEVTEETVIGCCMPDHVDLCVWWDKGCYCPGENMLVSSSLSTTGPKEVTVHGGYISIIQVTSIRARDGESKRKEATVARRDFICHPLHRFEVLVPRVPSSGLPHCSFIDTKYVAKFKLYTEYTSMEAKWDIAISASRKPDPSRDPSRDPGEGLRRLYPDLVMQRGDEHDYTPSAPPIPDSSHLLHDLRLNLQSSEIGGKRPYPVPPPYEKVRHTPVLDAAASPPPSFTLEDHRPPVPPPPRYSGGGGVGETDS